MFIGALWLCWCVDTFEPHVLEAQCDNTEGAGALELGHLGLHSWLWAGPCLQLMCPLHCKQRLHLGELLDDSGTKARWL